MTDVTPAIFTSDVATLHSDVAKLAQTASWIQIDLSDGTMVPAQTVMDVETLKAIVSAHPGISFEAHLMVDNPTKYVKPLSDAGFKRVIAQVEASDPRLFLDEGQLESVEVGFALDGASEVEVIEPFLESIDLAVIMTIEAGVADGPFLPECMEKIKSIRHHFPDLPIVAEGNIDERNAKLLTDAGVTRLVVSPRAFDAMQSTRVA
jgi:ribulose-phosphate 3-epimerase